MITAGDALSPEAKHAFRNSIFTTRPEVPCADCGGYHLRNCPRIKRIVMVGSGAGVGNRIEVEYWPPGTWEHYEIIWPEDVFDDD